MYSSMRMGGTEAVATSKYLAGGGYDYGWLIINHAMFRISDSKWVYGCVHAPPLYTTHYWCTSKEVVYNPILLNYYYFSRLVL